MQSNHYPRLNRREPIGVGLALAARPHGSVNKRHAASGGPSVCPCKGGLATVAIQLDCFVAARLAMTDVVRTRSAFARLRRLASPVLALWLWAGPVAAISVTEFGAVGDGRADDTRAIQAALDTGKRVVVPEGDFRITNALMPRSNQQIEIVGTIRVADALIQPLATDVPAGQPRIPVTDARGFYAGQWVTIADESLRIQGGGKNKVRREGGDCGRIARIEGNTLVMELNLRRGYSVAAQGRVGTQPSAFLITQSHVHIHGRGVIDGNKAHQFDFAPADMTEKKGRGEETRAGCGISIDSDPGVISHISIEGITVRDAILHNISLYRVRDSSVANVTCIGAHDKNILLRLSEGCRVIGNRCLDSQFEDGIILYSGNRHCVVQGNICSGNARMGICVNAFQTGILLAGNISINNSLNFSIRGDHGSSTGDFSSGGRVNIEGRGNSISGLVSLGAVSISATDLVYSGGTISAEEGKPIAIGMSIARTSPDRRVALVDRVRIRGVSFRGCTTAVRVSGVVKDVRLVDNRFQCDGPAVAIAEECRAEVSFARNEGYATEGSGVATIPGAVSKITVAHGLQVTPRIGDIMVTPAGSLGKARQFWIANPTATGFDLFVDAAPGAPGVQFGWRADAGK
ncbi:MAG: right-handed parallel beta-helix repeat-containing protein [Verrucomicrobia bacterium]|nr:right-handed parallel beta-helix repeat-containing protein [Verrucomicrobiota bacterium]